MKKQQHVGLNDQSKIYAMKKLWKEYNDINEKGDVPFTVGLVD